MPNSHSDPEVESYLRKAERDLATATQMAESGRDFADIVCFHAQQCAEKALKGLILSFETEPERQCLPPRPTPSNHEKACPHRRKCNFFSKIAQAS